MDIESKEKLISLMMEYRKANKRLEVAQAEERASLDKLAKYFGASKAADAQSVLQEAEAKIGQMHIKELNTF